MLLADGRQDTQSVSSRFTRAGTPDTIEFSQELRFSCWFHTYRWTYALPGTQLPTSESGMAPAAWFSSCYARGKYLCHPSRPGAGTLLGVKDEWLGTDLEATTAAQMICSRGLGSRPDKPGGDPYQYSLESREYLVPETEISTPFNKHIRLGKSQHRSRFRRTHAACTVSAPGHPLLRGKRGSPLIPQSR